MKSAFTLAFPLLNVARDPPRHIFSWPPWKLCSQWDLHNKIMLKHIPTHMFWTMAQVAFTWGSAIFTMSISNFHQNIVCITLAEIVGVTFSHVGVRSSMGSAFPHTNLVWLQRFPLANRIDWLISWIFGRSSPGLIKPRFFFDFPQHIKTLTDWFLKRSKKLLQSAWRFQGYVWQGRTLKFMVLLPKMINIDIYWIGLTIFSLDTTRCCLYILEDFRDPQAIYITRPRPVVQGPRLTTGHTSIFAGLWRSWWHHFVRPGLRSGPWWAPVGGTTIQLYQLRLRVGYQGFDP
jgi:hypothetical protein